MKRRNKIKVEYTHALNSTPSQATAERKKDFVCTDRLWKQNGYLGTPPPKNIKLVGVLGVVGALEVD